MITTRYRIAPVGSVSNMSDLTQQLEHMADTLLEAAQASSDAISKIRELCDDYIRTHGEA